MSELAVRDRPEGETAGSSQRPARQLAQATLSFNLAAEHTLLMSEPTWQRSDRNARTLVEEPGLRVVLTALKAGALLKEHRTNAWVSVQVVAGCVRVHARNQTVDLTTGHLIALEPNLPHDVEALKESAFLLTIAALQGGGLPA